jgi:hypothetical protein
VPLRSGQNVGLHSVDFDVGHAGFINGDVIWLFFGDDWAHESASIMRE